jgi:hypothetical protein
LARYTTEWVSTLGHGAVVELDVTADGPEAVQETAQKMFQELEKEVFVPDPVFGDWSDVADTLAAGC